MNILLVFLTLFLVSCTNEPVSPLAEVISGASYGSTASRVQFRRTGNLLKVSYNVNGFDVVTGPTFTFSRQDGDTLVYTSSGGDAVVSAISQGSVTVRWPGDGGQARTFTPRGERLGARP